MADHCLDPQADRLLTRYARGGDAQAFADLVRRLAADAERVALARLGNPADADDAVQAAFVAVYDHAARRYQSGSDARAWVMTLVVNACRMRHRADDRRSRHESAAAAEPIATDDVQRLAEAREELAGAIAAIDEPFRSALTLRYLRGMDNAEAARALAVPVKTVRSRVGRGLARLRRRLGVGAALALVAVAQAREGAGGVAIILPLAAAALAIALTLPFLARDAGDGGEPVGAVVPLDQPIAVEFHHDHLPEAIAELRRRIPALRDVRWAWPAVYDGNVSIGDVRAPFPWSGCSVINRPARPLAQALDEITAALGLRWQAQGDMVAFWRPAIAAESAAITALEDADFVDMSKLDPQRSRWCTFAASDLDLLRRLVADERFPHRRRLLFERDTSLRLAGRQPLSAMLPADGPAALGGGRPFADQIEGDSTIEQTDAALHAAASAGDDSERIAAMDRLSAITDQRALAALRPLVAVLAEDQWRNRRPRSLPSARTLGAPALAAWLADEDEPRMAWILATSLLALRDERAVPTVVAAIAGAPARRRAIAEALGSARDPRAEPAIVDLLHTSDLETVLGLIAGANATRSTGVAAEIAAMATGHASVQVRADALGCIGSQWQGAAALAALRAGLGDAEALPRGRAAIQLGIVRPDDRWLIDDLIRLVAHDPHPYVRAAALFGLCSDRTADLSHLLPRALRDSDPRVRLRAAALAAPPSGASRGLDPEVRTALIGATDDAFSTVRNQARYALRAWKAVGTSGIDDAIFAVGEDVDEDGYELVDAAEVSVTGHPVMGGMSTPTWIAGQDDGDGSLAPAGDG